MDEEENVGTEAETGTPTETVQTKPGTTPVQGQSTGSGFPEGTPVEQMTLDQQAAYWRFQAKKDVGLRKEQANELARLKAELEERRRNGMSDSEKAIADAYAEGAAAAAETLQTKLVHAEFRAQAKGRDIGPILSGVDPKRFLDQTGDVDQEKVASFFKAMYPDSGSPVAGFKSPASGSGPSSISAYIAEKRSRGASA